MFTISPEIGCGALGARQNHRVGIAQPVCGIDVTQAYSWLDAERVEIVEVRNPRQPDHGPIERAMAGRCGRRRHKLGGVFLRERKTLDERDNPYDGKLGALSQYLLAVDKQ